MRAEIAKYCGLSTAAILSLGGCTLPPILGNGYEQDVPVSTDSVPKTTIGVQMAAESFNSPTPDYLCGYDPSAYGKNMEPANDHGLMVPPLIGCDRAENLRYTDVDSKLLLSVCFDTEGGYALMNVPASVIPRFSDIESSQMDSGYIDLMKTYQDRYTNVLQHPDAKADGQPCAVRILGSIGPNRLNDPPGFQWYEFKPR